MKDEKGTDNKIIAVPLEKVDPRFKEVKSIDNLGQHLKEEIGVFFSDYKKLEKEKYKHVRIEGWAGPERAKKIIEKGVRSYKGE